MEEKKLIPKIRFKGFTGAWHKRKLGEISNSFSGGTPSIGVREFYNGKIPFIRSAEINSNSTEIFISELGLNNSSAKLVNIGCLLYALYGATSGEVGISKIDGAINQAILAIKPNNEIDVEFLMHWLRKKKKEIISTYLQGGQGNLSGSIVKNLDVNSPNLDEQKQIGLYFQNLDRLITLQQQKHDKLVKFKKAMLDKMFPKEGADVPEIRFNGFTRAWEERFVKELCSICTGKSNTQDQATDGIYPFYIRSEMPARSNKFLYDCEAVLAIGDGNIGKVFHYVDGKFDLHQRVYKMDEFKGILGKYFFYYFSAKFYKRAMKMTAKATVDSVRLEMISEMVVKMPVSINEQNQIAAYFTNLDKLITLHRQEIQKLKDIKKSCSEKMFV